MALTVEQEEPARKQLLLKINEYMSRAEYIKELETSRRLESGRAPAVDAAVREAL